MRKSDTVAKVFVAIAIVAIIFTGVALLFRLMDSEAEPMSFEECKEAGYPVLLSYPERCAVNGNTFVNPDQAERFNDE